MTATGPCRLVLLAPLALLLACDTQTDRPIVGLQAQAFKHSEWSAPVHLDPPVNTACQEQTPTLSKDELALYFTSNRRGGLGTDTPDGCQDTFDLWVARRASRDSPWETPLNLGPPVNTAANEAGPALSPDGHLLFFYSFVGTGQRDIHLSRRSDATNDLAWEGPVSLGPHVNSMDSEAGPSFVQPGEDGGGTLFFYRGGPPNTELYSVSIMRSGATLGPAVVVAELNSPVDDNHLSVRADGREIWFNSRRLGSILSPAGPPSFDIWVATRRSLHDAWSTPVNLGAPVNSPAAEFHPNISFDGRTLVFIDPSGAVRGGLGGFDIWMTTRTPSGN
jgi:hypothetical protein